MKVTILAESDPNLALFGLGLSYGLTQELSFAEFLASPELVERLTNVAKNLAPKDLGHNKFLEHIDIWMDITAPRYWWQQFDTYRIDVTRLSSSTMHTIMKRSLVQKDFEKPVPDIVLNSLNESIALKDFDGTKNLLPEGFLQRRTVKMSYMSLRKIIRQRASHKLSEWRIFCDQARQQLKNEAFLGL